MWDCPKVTRAIFLTNSVKDKMDRLKIMLETIQEDALMKSKKK